MNINPKRIATGILNYTFKEDTDIVIDRRSKCSTCIYKTEVAGQDMCSICKCVLKFKCSSPQECCPKNKWIDIKREKYPGGLSVRIVDIEKYTIDFDENTHEWTIHNKVDEAFNFSIINEERQTMVTHKITHENVVGAFPKDLIIKYDYEFEFHVDTTENIARFILHTNFGMKIINLTRYVR